MINNYKNILIYENIYYSPLYDGHLPAIKRKRERIEKASVEKDICFCNLCFLFIGMKAQN